MRAVGDKNAGPKGGIEGLDTVNENVVKPSRRSCGMEDDKARFLMFQRTSDAVNQEVAKEDVVHGSGGLNEYSSGCRTA